MTTTITELPIGKLHVGDNPRKDIDNESIAAMAASIRNLGILDPIRVVENADGYRIESGQRRYLGALAEGLETVPCIIVEQEPSQDPTSDERVRALATNIQRQDMNPVDEAEAFALLRDAGLTPEGVAMKLGVRKQRVTERLALLKLPTEIQELYRERKLGVSTRKSLEAVCKVSEPLAVEMAKVVAGKDDWQEVLASEPGRVAFHVATQMPDRFYAVTRGALGAEELAFSDEAKEALAEWPALHQAAYGYEQRPSVRLSDDDIDALNALGFVYEGKAGNDRTTQVITDVSVLSDYVQELLLKQLKKLRTEATKSAKKAIANGQVKGDVGAAGDTDASAEEATKEARKEERAARIEGQRLARAHNLELGAWLMNNLASVKTDLSLEQARFIAWSIVGPGRAELFLSGLRLVLDEFQAEEKVGAKGDRTKIVYVEGKTEAAKQFKAWFDRARTPGEVLGRMWVTVLASRLADQGAVPQSQRWQAGSGLPRLSEAYGHVSGQAIGNWSLAEPLKKIEAQVPKTLRPATKPSEKPMAAWRKKYSVSE